MFIVCCVVACCFVLTGVVGGALRFEWVCNGCFCFLGLVVGCLRCGVVGWFAPCLLVLIWRLRVGLGCLRGFGGVLCWFATLVLVFRFSGDFVWRDWCCVV